VEFDIPAYALRYTFTQSGFELKNLSNKPRRFKVDLSALIPSASHFQLITNSTTKTVPARSTLTLPAHAEAHWIPASKN
jgi:hypothetical protein